MEIIKIAENYMEFEIESIHYMVDILTLVHYVKYYYLPDCVVGDIEDLFEAIIEIAQNKDMFSLIDIFKNIKEKELGHKYLILYPNGTIDCFSDVWGLSYVLNIGEIIDDMIEEELLEKYCKRIE